MTEREEVWHHDLFLDIIKEDFGPTNPLSPMSEGDRDDDGDVDWDLLDY